MLTLAGSYSFVQERFSTFNESEITIPYSAGELEGWGDPLTHVTEGQVA